MKKLLIALTICLHTNVYSQCLTDHIQKEAEKNNPAIVTEKLNFFNNLQPISNQKRATKFIIPVVFHVIHTFGLENISEAQINDQIKTLNEDFSLNNPNKANIRAPFKTLAADCEIEFRLAKLDNNGKCTNGINRIYSPLHTEASDNVKSIANARWPNTKYLNIWLVSSIKNFNGGAGTILGYAYLPWSVANGSANVDGIIMRADYCGSIGTSNANKAGRTLTHEVGHYLGLLHTFQDGCDATNDNCADTPPVSAQFTNASCPSNSNSCSNDNPNLIDQWENYMDYSSGDCQSMFTPNQKTIMQNVINNYSFRKNLVSNANLIATGVIDGGTAPVAFFSSSSRTVCVGEKVFFYNNSCKSTATNKQWQLPGSSVTLTNKDTPQVVYTTPGKYKVTLMVSNTAGSNTLAVDNYIEVLPSVALKKPSLIQGFEDANWLTTSGWQVITLGTKKFIVDNSVGFSGTNSLVNETSVAGDKMRLISPPIDLRPLKNQAPKLSMMVAYLRQNTSSTERMRIYAARGCGNNWIQLTSRTANQLAYNATKYQSTFKPASSSDWRLITTSLSNYENDSSVSFMIEVETGGGNPVYIDDINISQYNTSISLTEKSINLNVFPNPTSNNLTVNYENITGETQVWIENIEGKKIEVLSENNAQTGNISIKWTANNSMPTGVYILKIKANEQVISKKIIFAN